jgi:hypothetical protein
LPIPSENILQRFAERTGAAVDHSATSLATAAVAAVLGGLDRDADSSSFEGARRANTAIVDMSVSTRHGR